jgi:hypothetical protein
MKYICFDNADTGKEEVILFPNSIHHDCMVEAADRIRNQSYGNWKRVDRMPISAGFVDSNMVCHGRSETLDLDSRPEDTLILKQQLMVSP